MGRAFTGAGLRFCGRVGQGDHRQTQYVHSHKIGGAMLHLGRHRHGADNIATGERLNLIMWGRSSYFRAAAAFGYVDVDGYPLADEEAQPDRGCLSLANDPDYAEQLRQVRKSNPPWLAIQGSILTGCGYSKLAALEESAAAGSREKKNDEAE